MILPSQLISRGSFHKPPLRASTKSMLCHRKSASSLSMEASICCKMAFSGIKYLKTLILRPQIDIGSNILLNLAIRHCRIPACTSASRYALCLIGPSSACFRHWRRQTPALGDAHVAACGLQSKGAEAPGKPALGLVFSGGRAGRPRAAMPGGPFDASPGFVDSLTRRPCGAAAFS